MSIINTVIISYPWILFSRLQLLRDPEVDDPPPEVHLEGQQWPTAVSQFLPTSYTSLRLTVWAFYHLTSAHEG